MSNTPRARGYKTGPASRKSTQTNANQTTQTIPGIPAIAAVSTDQPPTSIKRISLKDVEGTVPVLSADQLTDPAILQNFCFQVYSNFPKYRW